MFELFALAEWLAVVALIVGVFIDWTMVHVAGVIATVIRLISPLLLLLIRAMRSAALSVAVSALSCTVLNN